MPLELRKGSKWWYGRFEVGKKRFCKNLGVKVRGTRPASLRDISDDPLFELSRGRAKERLEKFVAEAHSNKSAESLVQSLHEIKYGSKILTYPIAELVKAWDSMPKRKQSLHRRYVTDVHATIKRFTDHMAEKHPDVLEAAQVTRAYALEFMDKETSRDMAAKTWNDTLKRMRAIFKFLQIEYGVLRNPFDGIRAHTEEHVHRKPITMEELKKLLEKVKDDDFCRPLIVCGVSTAMRLGDCCTLKWANVQMTGPHPAITVKTSKTGETVCIPIYKHLMEELRLARGKWDGECEYVWPRQARMQVKNQQGVTWRLRKAFRDTFGKGAIREERTDRMRDASVRDFHSLRTTWITEALTRGVPIETVKMISGHKTVEVVTTYYFRPGQEQLRTALETAMPKMLTEGEGEKDVEGQVAKAGDAKTQVLEICKAMTGKTWKKDAERIAELVAAMG